MIGFQTGGKVSKPIKSSYHMGASEFQKYNAIHE